MQLARIDDLLRIGPNERIIFERDTQSPEAVAQLIASLANTQGGTIVFGITPRGRVKGLRDAQAAVTMIGRAADGITPHLLLDPQVVTRGDKQLILLDVPQGSDAPYSTAGGHIPIRVGKRSTTAGPEQAGELARRALRGALLVPLPPEQRDSQRLVSKSAAPTIDLEHVMLKLERLIIANADLARKLDDANSWRSRIADQLIGAVLGLLVSTAVFYALGIG